MNLDFRSLYLQTNGRTDRTTFWLAALILVSIYVIVKYIGGLLTATLVSIAPTQFAQIVGFAINALVPLAFLYPAYCLFVKRGNDRGRPALIVQVLAGFVALVYLAPKIIILSLPQETAKSILQPLGEVFWAIYLLLAVAAIFILVDFGLRESK